MVYAPKCLTRFVIARNKNNIIIYLRDNWAGYEEWFDDDGLRHRDNGAAIKWTDGNKEYYIHGIRHRIGGPAFIWGKSYQYWVDGELHRIDGPAVYRSEKRNIGMPEVIEHWVDGKQIKK